MIGNVALDVTIGLVFVYLLYSLYATVIMEIISSVLALRARNLCYALRRMLMDETKYNDTLDEQFLRILTSITQVTGYAGNLHNSKLYDKFFSQPTIKYLCGGGISNRPSYLTAESFSKALIDSIRIDDPDITMLGSIEIGLQKALEEDEIGNETWKHIQSLLEDSNNDLVKFKILLEQWYNDTMERATGWYKRNVQIFLAVTGLTLAITFNVDSVAIVKKLARDKDARDQLVKLATDFNDQNGGLIERLNGMPSDSVVGQSVDAMNGRIDSLNVIRRSLEQDMSNAESVLGAAWNLPDTLTYFDKDRPVKKDFVMRSFKLDGGSTIYLPLHKSIDASVLAEILPYKPHDAKLLIIKPWKYKIHYVFTWRRLGGYFLTMLAISLGAPFWFDLLNKLVKLRTSQAVKNPAEEKSGSSGLSNANRSTLNRVG